jgi:hypothetical protein
MQAFMRKGAESPETGKLPGEDEMSNKTSVRSPADGPPAHGPSAKRVEEELVNPESTTTANAKEYCAIGRGSKKAEDSRRASEHTRAERLVVWNFGEEDIKTIRVGLAAHGIHAANMDIDIDAIGFWALRSIRRRPREQREREKDFVYPIGDGEKQKAKKNCTKRRGPRWDSNPRGYEQEIGPSHLRK